MRNAVVAATVVAVLGHTAQARQVTRAPGDVVVGRVFDATSGVVLARAEVLAGNENGARTAVLTDDDGRFAISYQKVSRVTLSVRKAGYATASLISQVDSRHLETPIGLERAGAIAGEVVTSLGVPVAGAMVNVVGLSKTKVAPVGMRVSAKTDDRGRYRLGGLSEGRYAVSLERDSAIDGSKTPLSDVTTMTSPERPSGDARILDVRASQEINADLVKVTSMDSGCAPGASQSVNPSLHSLRGRLLDDLGHPVACASILLKGAVDSRRTLSDRRGTFSFQGLKSGSYVVFAIRPDRTFPNDSAPYTVTVPRDGRPSRVDLVMTRGSAITGQVVDDRGEPLEGASVEALRVRVVNGHQQASSVAAVKTDDRGMYRIFGLASGEYMIAASMDADVFSESSETPRGLTPVFYPGVANSDQAARLRLQRASNQSGLDFAFTLTDTARLSGVAFDPDTRPLRGTVYLARNQKPDGIRLEPRRIRIREDGTFVFSSVVAGDYTLQAVGTRLDSGGTAFGLANVSVSTGPTPQIRISTTFGGTLNVQLSVEDIGGTSIEPPPLMLAPDYAALSPAIDAGILVSLSKRGVTIGGVHGSRRFVLAPRGSWYLKSAYINGRNVADEPYDFGFDAGSSTVQIVLSQSGAEVEGSVIGVGRTPTRDCWVFIFSANRDHWFPLSRFTRRIPCSAGGRFEARGLPPAEYYIAALEIPQDSEHDGSVDPEQLSSLSAHAQLLSVTEGERIRVSLGLHRASVERH